MPRMFIFGLGYSARYIALSLESRGWEVNSTGRDGTLAFGDSGNVRVALANADYILSSVPPNGEGSDPVLEMYGDALGGKALSYLSSTGVYGDCGGAWVDEGAATGTGRALERYSIGATKGDQLRTLAKEGLDYRRSRGGGVEAFQVSR